MVRGVWRVGSGNAGAAGGIYPGAGAGAKAGELTRWRTLPLNSLARQNSDLHLLRNAAPTVVKMLQSTGLNAVPPNLNAMPVSVETWLASPASEGWRLLWLTLPDGKSGVLVPVDGVRNSAALGELATRHPGSSSDRKASFDSLFALYRSLLSGLLGVALAVIAGGAMLRLGWRKGLVALVPSVLSLGGGLAALAVTGHPVNLFLLALVLVLGIGINYTLFSATRAARR